MCEAIKEQGVRTEGILFLEARKYEMDLRKRIHDYKRDQHKILKKQLFVIDVICMVELMVIGSLMIFIWYNYTDASVETFIKFFITIGVLILLSIVAINDRIKAWFRKRRNAWIRSQVRKIK